MSEAGPAHARTPFPTFLFGITGRIGPGAYWAAIGCAFLCLVAAMGFAAALMSPTGSGAGGAILAVPLLFFFVWIIAAAMAQRLRDAGKSPWLAVLFLILLVAWLYPAIELIEAAPYVGVLGLAAILGFVGHIDTIFKLRTDTA